ncbi:MAG: hypothetical protein LBO72_01580 [Helicobacteraceae bacterium]|jgi:hypothetical protein|nr:hypothetical protein [Helicobacteraceae bacterium]
MKFLSDLIERYKRYRQKECKKRLTSSNSLRDLLTGKRLEHYLQATSFDRDSEGRYISRAGGAYHYPYAQSQSLDEQAIERSKELAAAASSDQENLRTGISDDR